MRYNYMPSFSVVVNVVVVLVICHPAKVVTFTTAQTCDYLCHNRCSNESFYYKNATKLMTFYKHLNAIFALLRTAVASDALSQFGAVVPSGSSSAMAANFICLGHVSHADCLASLADVIATVNGSCPVKLNDVVFTEACYLFYVIGDVYSGDIVSDFYSCEERGYCDGVLEEGEVAAQLTERSREVIRRKGRFVVAKKVVTVVGGCGGRRGVVVVYAALQCTPAGAYRSFDCQKCLQVAIKNAQYCLWERGAVATGLGCSVRYSQHAFFDESLVASNTGEKRDALNWERMYDIIVGIARGLAYLHEESYNRIIHRDVKPGNILFDEDFQPKVADFGLARLLPPDKTHLQTKLAGTLGYTAPEYIIHGKLSEKVDVYSFGVVVLQILTGKRCLDLKVESHKKYLLHWAWELHENGRLMELLNGSVECRNESEGEEVKRVAEIGLMCTQSAWRRPSMSTVVSLLLNNDQPKLTQLTRPDFIYNLH